MAWHRLYRPRRFCELDQLKVREAFERILHSGVFSGAYLLTGPRGTGKTTAARILAATVNCEHNRTTPIPLNEPCGTCEWCRSIFGGGAASVLEIDAASNRGIDDIRQLRERVGLMPSDGAAKMVFIIDEVHMLTSEAFNALLKTLEEPPAHVLFCLATTERHKVPATVLSRCVEVSYGSSSAAEIEASLNRVIKAEKVKIDPEALVMLSEAASGSFREAVIFLEQLASSQPITVEAVAEITGHVSHEHQLQLIEALLSHQTQTALDIIESTHWNQSSAKALVGSLVTLTSSQLREALKTNSPHIPDLIALIELFGKSLTRSQEIPLPKLPLLLAVAEWHHRSNPQTQTTPPASNPTTPKPPASPRPKSLTPPTQKKTVPLAVTPPETSEAVTIVSATTTQVDPEVLAASWSMILSKVEARNKGVKVFLAQAALGGVVEGRVVISTAFEFHRQRLSEERNKLLIESCIQEVINTPVVLEIVQTKQAVKTHKADHNIAPIPGDQDAFVSSVEEALGL